MLEDIRNAMRAEKRWLARLMSPSILAGEPTEGAVMVPAFQSETVCRLLRIEIARDSADAIWMSARSAQEAFDFREHYRGEKPGPWCLEDVAVYEVSSLPAPGWRVINPMRPK